jgi:two-component system, cell cycle sensor histidine kinase and response regulator CckA
MADPAGLILVIEDDPGTALLQRKCLERCGYRVFTAGSHEQAWEVLSSHAIELILLDYKLQEGETGLDLLAELQAAGRDIPCIVVTGFGNEQLAINAFRAGARDFVPKSVTYLDSLPQAVDRVFRDLRREEELRRSDEHRRRLVHDLGERVKELTLLREVSRLMQDINLSTDQLLNRIVELLPSGFQAPDATTACVRLGARVWAGAGFRTSPAMLRAGFRLLDGTDGTLEVSLVENQLKAGRPPFLHEEESLLRSLTEMVAMHLDRRQAVEQLRRSEQRYRSLVEASTVVIWTADASGKLSQVAPVLDTVTGSEANSALGDGWTQLIHPEDLPHVAAAWAESLRLVRPHHVIARIRRADGSFMHCEVRAVPVMGEHGEVLEWFGTLHDITQQHEYEATLARLAAIVESSNDAIVSETVDGVILSWNPGAEQIYGYSSEEVEGRSIEVLMPPESLEEHRQILRRVATGEQLPPYESVRLRRDGRQIDVLVRASGIRDAAGRIIAISSIAHEITERKAAERRRQLQGFALQALADTSSIEEAACKLVRGVCDAYGWSCGNLWLMDDREKVLRHAAGWSRSKGRLDELVEFSGHLTFGQGQGLPGEAWQKAEPVWISDFVRHRRYPRAEIARELGLLTAIAFPLRVGERTVGVIDFFSADIRQPSVDDLTAVGSLWSQFALFIDRKLTEMKRAQLAAILEASTDFVSMASPEGRILYLNKAGRQMLGLAEMEDVANIAMHQCGPAWVTELLRSRAIPAAVRDGSWTGEAAIWNRNGYEIPVSMLLLAHSDGAGRPQFFSMIGRDITEQKRDRESLLLHTRAMSATSEGIVISGPATDDAPILYANEAFLQLTGYSLAQVIGRNCRFLQGPGSDPDSVEAMRNAILNEEPCTVELLNYKADGTSFWNLVSITPVRDGDGLVTHFVGTQRDISERRRLEDQLRQTQKMEAIGSLAGGIAHDFNNMLTVILGYGEMARDTLPPEDATHDLLDEMISAAQRAATLTGQLLAFSRRQMLAPSEVDINAILTELQRLLRPLISENIAIVPALAPDLWSVKADPSQFEQIVMNLVINARDAMPQGGQLSLTTANVVMTEQSLGPESEMKPGHYVRLTVADTGHGMTTEVMARVFEPFYTTKPKGKGTGMGLATVYGIVKQSGGHIEVISEPGCGSTFNVYLPRAESMQTMTAPKDELTRAAPRGEETVLLVEDENPVREYARQVLAEQGYRVIEASRGDEALALLDEISTNIDALVTDVIMPGMGGRQLADRLQQERPGIKVLFLSGYTDDVLGHHGVLDAGTAFLQKPFSREALTRKLRQVLDG